MDQTDSSLLVRDAVAGDDAAVARLLAAQLDVHGVAADVPAILGVLASLREQGDRTQLLLALRDGLIAGVLFANRFVSFERPGRGWFIEELFVAPEFRRRGVARALIGALHSRAAAEGCSLLALQLQAGHDEAAALYRGLGFTTLDRRALELPLSGAL